MGPDPLSPDKDTEWDPHICHLAGPQESLVKTRTNTVKTPVFSVPFHCRSLSIGEALDVTSLFLGIFGGFPQKAPLLPEEIWESDACLGGWGVRSRDSDPYGIVTGKMSLLK